MVRRSEPEAGELVHVECQGYHDTGFEPRTLWYHVGFALRHRRKRRVRTVAIWLTTPPRAHPRDHMTVDDITVKVTTIVLHEVKASVLLRSPSTACFAAGADSEGRTAKELCSAVAAALRLGNASWAERHMAVVAAAMRGRYKEMVMAMEDANLEPVIIEDLVKFGEDRGRKKGLVQGRKQGRAQGIEEGIEKGRALGIEKGRAQGIEEGRREEEREVLRLVFVERKLSLTPEQKQQIDTCADLETLRRWVKQAISAKIAADALR